MNRVALTLAGALSIPCAGFIAGCGSSSGSLPRVQAAATSPPVVATSVPVAPTSVPVVATSAPSNPVPSDFQMYNSSNFPYSMSYPSSWSAQSRTVGTTTVDAYVGTITNAFANNVNVIAESVDSLETSEQYVSHVESLSQQAGLSLQGQDNIQVGGSNAVFFHFTNPGGLTGQANAGAEAVFVANGRGWQVTLTTDPSVESQYEPTFRQMLDTFQLSG